MSSELLVAIGCGIALGLGCFLAVSALLPTPVRLEDALARLDGTTTGSANPVGVRMIDPMPGQLDRAGVWCYERLRLPLTDQTARLLALQGRSIGDYFAEKAVWVLAGFSLPLVYAVVTLVMGGAADPLPLVFSLVGALVGYVVPDALLRRSAATAREGASEALFMFFDLVVLERLANRSVTQALHSVAGVSEVTVFSRIRTALDRARLEQVAPWNELRRLSAELELPVIADMADVLKLDEQGASLAEPLRARVRELRDAQLTRAKQQAHEHTERMTLWMTLPVLIFGVTFLVPPLLLMMQG